MTTERRKSQLELANRLHDALGTHEVQVMLELLKGMRLDSLEVLASCEEGRVKEYQGRIRAIDDIERMITRPPIRSI